MWWLFVKPLTVKKNQGKLTYTKISGSKKIAVNSKRGKFTVAKGLKKATYKVKVRIIAMGNSNYKSAKITKTVEIIVNYFIKKTTVYWFQ